MDEERDLVEFQDNEGNSITMEVVDYFFYEGKEYALLEEALAPACEGCEGESCEGCEDAAETFIMRVEPVGEDEEEFVPVEDEALFDKLVDFVQNELYDDGEDEGFFDDEEGFEDAKDE